MIDLHLSVRPFMRDAELACNPYSADDFFPSGSRAERKAARENAVSICKTCPTLAACLEDDLTFGDPDRDGIPTRGIRAALTENERRSLKGLPPIKEL